jgi:hypothetical protein
VTGSCVNSNETSRSMKGGEFTGQMNGYQVLKKDSVLLN